VPLPVAGHLQRVDREHLVAGGDQRGHPPAPIGLDPDHHLLGCCVLGQEPADQTVQLGDPSDPLRQPSLAQPPPGLVLDFDIVMIFGPVVPDQQQRSSSVTSTSSSQPRERHQRPNGQVLTHEQRHVIPSAVNAPDQPGRGTICL